MMAGANRDAWIATITAFPSAVTAAIAEINELKPQNGVNPVRIAYCKSLMANAGP